MKSANEFADYAAADVRRRSLHCDSTMLAPIADDGLYLKADDVDCGELQRADARQRELSSGRDSMLRAFALARTVRAG